MTEQTTLDLHKRQNGAQRSVAPDVKVVGPMAEYILGNVAPTRAMEEGGVSVAVDKLIPLKRMRWGHWTALARSYGDPCPHENTRSMRSH